MDITVLGSGVIGLTTAWYLQKAGHQVTVIDRQASSGLETSFANAGQISFGYSAPWAAPGVPFKALKWLFEKRAPLKFKPTTDLWQYQWSLAMLRNCTTNKYQINKGRMISLANLSQVELNRLNTELDLKYEGQQKGTLQLFRTQKQVEAVQKDMEILARYGTPFKLLSPEQCLAQEPGLRPVMEKIKGGLLLPNDQTGDCFKFCQALTERARQAGVKFLFNTQIEGLVYNQNRVTHVATDQGDVTVEHLVVAMGSHSKFLLSNLGINLPIYPVKGYSLTLPVDENLPAPQSTIMDETYKVAITRFKNRMRVAGTAELAGFNLSTPTKRLDTLQHVIRELFPNQADFKQAETWSGLRPMTPDGTPLIGRTSFQNLYLNTGHGTLGWTLACGSAKYLSDIIEGKSNSFYAESEYNLLRYT